MNPQSAIVLMDAIALMNGNKTISEMIADIPVRKPQPKPHQGAKEMARRKNRVTKLPDEKDDDTEVELVSSQRTYYTSPPDQSAKIAELEAEVAKLTAIIEDMKVVDNVFSK